MRKYIETFILFVVGLGPTLIALLLMQQYGAIGVTCAIVLSSLYLLCIIIALCCRICIPPAGGDDDDEVQGDLPNDLPPSYDIVTSKPPPYYVLFASAPPSGENTRCGYAASPTAQLSTLTSSCEVPVHSFRGTDTTRGVHCYAWLEPCEDKDLPSYEDALVLSSIQPVVAKEEAAATPNPVVTVSTDVPSGER